MRLPPIFYVEKFWEGLSYIIAGVLLVLYLFNKIPVEWVIGPSAILAWFLAILKLIGVVPTLRK